MKQLLHPLYLYLICYTRDIPDLIFDRCFTDFVQVMQNASAGGSPLDFLARFAGPIAWLIAGLLLLFGGLPFGGGEQEHAIATYDKLVIWLAGFLCFTFAEDSGRIYMFWRFEQHV